MGETEEEVSAEVTVEAAEVAELAAASAEVDGEVASATTEEATLLASSAGSDPQATTDIAVVVASAIDNRVRFIMDAMLSPKRPDTNTFVPLVQAVNKKPQSTRS